MEKIALYNNNSELLRKVVLRLHEEGIAYQMVDACDATLHSLYILEDNLQYEKLKEIYVERSNVFSFQAVIDTLVVGPFRKSSVDSCPACLETRMHEPFYESILSVTTGMTLPSLLNDAHVSLIVDLIGLLQQNPSLQDRYVNRMEHVNLATDRITSYRVVKDERCPACGEYMKDEVSFEGRLQSVPKKHVNEYRVNPAIDISILQEQFLDPNTGIFRRQFRELRSAYVESSGVEMKVTKDYTESGYGRSYSRTAAAKLGFLEGLERYCGIFDRRAQSTIYEPYEELIGQAINPVAFGLHSEEEINHPKYDLKVYNDNLPIYWKYAYSCKEDRKLLVPEQLVFFGDAFYRSNGNRFAYDSSNGMALGSTYEEAVLYGLLELIERDNFLCAWYNQLPLQEIDIHGIQSPQLERLLFYARQDGIEVRFFDISMELGIPSVWALANNTSANGRMKSYNAAAAHLIPEKAIEGAALEVLTSLPIYEHLLAKDDRVRERVAWLEGNPEGVTEFEDHVLFYATESNAQRLNFIQCDRNPVPIRDLYAHNGLRDKFNHLDLKRDLENLIQLVLQYYSDVLIVNVTPQHIEEAGLCAVKVIVPGMLPMTFGNQHKRVIHNRLLMERQRRGLSERFIVNQDPHPFP